MRFHAVVSGSGKEQYTVTIDYVRTLKKQEARNQLPGVLESGAEWQWERFIREHIE